MKFTPLARSLNKREARASSSGGRSLHNSHADGILPSPEGRSEKGDPYHAITSPRIHVVCHLYVI